VAYNTTNDLKCFNISQEYYPCADITGCGGGDDDPDARSWDWQSCTEIISNPDTNNVTEYVHTLSLFTYKSHSYTGNCSLDLTTPTSRSMFPPAPYNFTALQIYCAQRWNATPDPLKIPQMYNYTTGSRIIFSNGDLDPWWPGMTGTCNTTGRLRERERERERERD
jgi:hypothetical protein